MKRATRAIFFLSLLAAGLVVAGCEYYGPHDDHFHNQAVRDQERAIERWNSDWPRR